ncbi:GNAT family N-acetyltransferase [Microbacterium schleiferi]|uniref:GNAT family N-acetyltransferase n=1 Tax=Microbacterium schleiferi TaxID=69362 RepID=A0A7S8RI55_9MICO|nr:GNAT family N-acetyltransferase [Microbacterium schleiferi]QPE05821.1 GNAT family N-acetyltransferase [Microbacterium schleiferi]
MAGARGGVARYDVRRVRLHEWEAVRALRIRATGDPDAGVAFLTSREEELARDDSFWQARTAGGALGENAAQFVAIAGGGRWIGTVTVLLRAPGEIDHLGHPLTAPRADIVGVYIDPDHRGQGVLSELVDVASAWAKAGGHGALTLDVHQNNARAQRAYARLGFAPTGVTFVSTIGPELEMRRAIE